MAEAIQQKADLIITQGAVQSNHVRQTAAIATKLGFACHVLLEERVSTDDVNYYKNGNVLLDKILGASHEFRPAGTDMNAAMKDVADKFAQDGKKVYVIPGGGSNPVGALGYANAALELVYQATQMNMVIDCVVLATGSTGTQAGLVAGLKTMGSGISVLGVSVRLPSDKQIANVLRTTQATCELLGNSNVTQEDILVAKDDYVGEGYGIPTKECLDAIYLLSREEGILLDPVYSSKGMAGMLDLSAKGYFKKGQNIVFLHTGGSQALSGYLNYFE